LCPTKPLGGVHSHHIHAVWSNIKDPLVNFLQESKNVRERPEVLRGRRASLAAVLTTFVATQHPYATIPNIADFAEMEKFKAMIEDTPIQEGIITTQFEDAMADFPTLVDDWRRAKNTELVAIMKVERTDAVESMLLLATTFFRCKVCEIAVEYSRILDHSCLAQSNLGNTVHVELRCAPWNHTRNGVSFHRGAWRAAQSILTACDLDPNMVTTEGLRSSDPLIECMTCSNRGQDLLMMKWYQAVRLFRLLKFLSLRV
jgi:hypothetical protein